MKKALLIAAMLVFSLSAFAQLPSVKVENAAGEPYTTTTLLKAGVPSIVSFWSTSCKPCIRELDAVYEAYPDWAEEVKFQVVAVSTDDNRLLSKARSLAEGHGWSEDFVLLFDKNQDFMRAMNVSVVPHVFVLDGNGKVVYSHTSYIPGNEIELFEAVKKAAKTPVTKKK
jgi:peroxiredoxin